MNTGEYLDSLKSLGIEVSVKGEQLEVRSPRGTMNANLRSELDQRKPEIIEWIKSALPQSKIQLSHGQRRMWYLNRLTDNSDYYHVNSAWRINGSLDVDALVASLQTVVERHEILRTGYPDHLGDPYGELRSSADIKILLVPLLETVPAGLDGQARSNHIEYRLQQHLEVESCRPFDLQSDLPLRVHLYQLAEEQFVLHLVFHHIVTDAWSSEIFKHELQNHYQSAITGKSFNFSPIPTQFAEYARWQCQCIESGLWDDQLDYWQERLSQLKVLELPTDYPRPNIKRYAGATTHHGIAGETMDRVVSFCKQQRVTPFMFYLAVFKLLLARYSGETDIAVGCPIANRSRADVQHTIGFFLNTMIIRSHVDVNHTFLEYLGKVREQCLQDYCNQDVPLDLIVDRLNPDRDLSHTPLFQTMFVFNQGEREALQLSGVETRLMSLPTTTSKCDLTLFVATRSGQLNLALNYDTDLFGETSMQRFLSHFQVLLAAIIDAPDACLKAHSLLDASERQCVLHRWNATTRKHGEATGIHQLFEQQVVRSPEAAAAFFDGEELSYEGLNERANQLAHYLQSQDVHRDVIVGLCLEKGLDLLVGVLGILKAGGAYLPLDPVYPGDRLLFMLDDSGAAIVITHNATEQLVSDCGKPLVNLDTMSGQLRQQCQENPAIQGDANDLCYCLYTSGSTGEPKGIEQIHGTLLNLTFWQPTDAHRGILPRKLQFASFGFDPSILEIFTCWHIGGTIFMVAEFIRKDPRKLLDYLIEREITSINTTSIMLDLLANESMRQNRYPASLREYITAGDQLILNETIRRFFKGIPQCRYYNQYGPTETQVVTCHEIIDFESTTDYVPIGKPIDNTRIYILDTDRQPVPVGIVGEIYAAGAGLARGYCRNDRLTRETFIADPFSDDPAERVYDTGDRARRLENGDIQFFGRRDRQLKIRGYRIEPAEIETRIRQFEAVDEAAVDYIENKGNRQLRAIVVFRGKAPRQWRSRLQSYLKRQVPDYMVPAIYLSIPRMPLTGSGKLDRIALSQVNGSEIDTDVRADQARPKTASEKKLLSIWQETLATGKPLGIDDNFFDAGGNSLLAVRLVTKIEVEFAQSLPLEALHQFQTIATMAQHIDDGKPSTVPRLFNLSPTGMMEQARFIQNRENPVRQQYFYITGWDGYRATPQSMVVQHNPQGCRPGFFWCGQDYGELRSIGHYSSLDCVFAAMRSSRFLPWPDDEYRPELAERYATEVVQIQGEGPYFLGGYCLGVPMILEVARILIDRGLSVASLVLVEGIHHVLQKMKPIDAPATVVYASDAHANPYRTFKRSGHAFGHFFPAGYEIKILRCRHDNLFHEPNIQELVKSIERTIDAPPGRKPAADTVAGQYIMLSDSGRRAGIYLNDGLAALQWNRLLPGVTYQLRIQLYNQGTDVWAESERSGIYLYHRWLSPDMKVVQWGHSPVPISLALEPPYGCLMLATIQPPMDPGAYVLSFDVVEEGITWFRKSGSIPLNIACTVIENDTGKQLLDDDTDQLLQLARDQFRNRDLCNCVDNYKRLMAQNVELPADDYHDYSEALVADVRHDKGNEILDQLLTPDWRRFDSSRQYGEVCMAAGRNEMALSSLIHALSLENQDTRVLQLIGETYAELDDQHAALHYLKKAVDQEPNRLELRLSMATVYRRFNHLDEAIHCVRHAIHLAPSFAFAYERLAQLLLDNGTAEQALEIAQTAWVLDPDRIQISRLLLQCHQALGNDEQLAALVQWAVKKGPGWQGIQAYVDADIVNATSS